jgi:hypothetical protein
MNELIVTDIASNDLDFNDVVLSQHEIDEYNPIVSATAFKIRYKKWKKEAQWIMREILLAYVVLKDGKHNTSFNQWCELAGLHNASYARELIIKNYYPDEHAEQKKKVIAEKTYESVVRAFDVVKLSDYKKEGNTITLTFDVMGQELTKEFNL